MKLLLIESDDLLRDSLVAHLKNKGHQVVSTPRGAEAVGMISDAAIEAVVAELPADDARATDALATIRELRPNVPMILLCNGAADLEPGFGQAAGLLGAAALVSKPFPASVLIQAIDRLE